MIIYPKEKEDWPKISIVTPSFNQGSYIEQTIRSVLLQNYPNLEYFIIDGGSTDDTIDIIKKYESHITGWISEKDSGQSEAINKGLAKCTGEIFNWLNSDDWYEPGALFKVADAFNKNSSIQFVSGYENHIDETGNVQLYSGSFLLKTLEETIELCEVAQPSTFFRLASVKAVEGVNNQLHNIMDGHLWVKSLLQYGQRNTFYKIQEPLVNFRYHSASKTRNEKAGINFLTERASIICDLQKFIGVPDIIRNYFIQTIYETPSLINLETNWRFNRKVISPKKLKAYFMKKYVMKQFRRKDPAQAFWGLRELIKSKIFDWYVMKGFAKLIFKTWRY